MASVKKTGHTKDGVPLNSDVQSLLQHAYIVTVQLQQGENGRHCSDRRKKGQQQQDGSWDSVIGIAIKLGTGQPGVRIPVQATDFIFSNTSRKTVRPTQPPSQLAPGFVSGGKAARE